MKRTGLMLGLWTLMLFCAGARGENLVISEVMSRNTALYQLDFCDYVELYNAGEESVNLGDYTLCRGENNEKKCDLPDKTLKSGEYALLLCDGAEITFSLPGEGCRLSLLRGEETADEARVPSMEKGEVWIRNDGVGVNPSPGYENTENGIRKWTESAKKTLCLTEAVSCAYPDGDWVEIRNDSGESVSLSGFYLSDERENLKKWQLPEIDLPSGGYYTVNCDEENGANFCLSSKGETVYLSDENGNIEDALAIPSLRCNESFGVKDDLHGYFAAPTKGCGNGELYAGISEAPVLSVASGIYEDAVTVEISGTGVIYYTTDGSEPDEHSAVYQGEAITVSTAGAVRAVAVQTGRLISDCVTGQYGVKLDEYELPVLMISASKADIFGANGIYTQYGSHSLEAKINLTLLEDGKECFNIDCGLKIFGNNSRERLKKSFQVRFRSRYGEDTLNYPLFENSDVTGFHSLVLRSGAQDDNHSLFRDEFLTSLGAETMPDVLIQGYKPVNLFINGEYRGIYFIREKVDEDYAVSHLGGAEEDIDIVNSWAIEEYGDKSDWTALNAYCRRADLSVEENYQYVASQISVTGFADYYIARAYSGDRDYVNIRICRSRGGDNLWRIVNFDLDFAFLTEERPLSALLEERKEDNSSLNNIVITALLKNEGFRELFLERLAGHLRTTYDTERVLNVIDETAEKLRGDIEKNQLRWGFTVENWEKHVQSLRDFVKDGNGTRIMEMMNDAKKLFNLTDGDMERIFGDLWQ